MVFLRYSKEIDYIYPIHPNSTQSITKMGGSIAQNAGISHPTLGHWATGTGTYRDSLEARCLRQDAQVLVNSMGSLEA